MVEVPCETDISGYFWIYTEQNSPFCHTHTFAKLESEPVGACPRPSPAATLPTTTQGVAQRTSAQRRGTFLRRTPKRINGRFTPTQITTASMLSGVPLPKSEFPFYPQRACNGFTRDSFRSNKVFIVNIRTGVSRTQEPATPYGPAAGLSRGPYDGPKEGSGSCVRPTPVPPP